MHTLVRFFHFRSHFSFFRSRSLYIYIYISVVCSFIHLLSFSSYHSHFIYLFFYSPSLSHFSMIQRSSRGSNLVPPRIQKRLTRQFPRSYAHFTKNWRVSRHCDESARRKRRHSRKIVAYRRNDRRRPEDADSGISNKPVATRGPATRHSFRSGDRIGPRVAAATYIIILIMIIILEIGAPHNARDDGTRSPGIP